MNLMKAGMMMRALGLQEVGQRILHGPDESRNGDERMQGLIRGEACSVWELYPIHQAQPYMTQVLPVWFLHRSAHRLCERSEP